MSDKKNFGYLGNTFQIQLLNNIITYKDFSNSILEVIDPHYFDNQYFRIICQIIVINGKDRSKRLQFKKYSS